MLYANSFQDLWLVLVISFVFGLLINFIKNFDKNQYYFMPLHSPTKDWYPEWQESMSIIHKFQDNSNGKTNQITLHGYISCPLNKVLPSDIIILYIHGNAGNIYVRIPHFQEIIQKLDNTYKDGHAGKTEIRQHVLVAFDYRGFGLSSGIPTVEGILEDGLQMVIWCRSKFPQNKIILYGESIGTSVVANLALAANPDGIILKSPFSSMHSLVSDILHLPGIMREIPKWIIPDDFLTEKWLINLYHSDTIEYYKTRGITIKKPEMVILYNKDDELIPSKNIKGLLDKYKSVALEGGHNDCSLEDSSWLEGVCHVLDKI
jgi:pimeloyl-ACP methyl ester carboxylesterase